MINQDLYYVITALRGFSELKKQMIIDNLSDDDLVNMIVDGGSLLEIAIAARQYEIANYLLDHNSPVNVITPERYNEFHIIAPHLRYDESVAIAERLLGRGVDLSHTDKKYHNTAMFSIARDTFVRPTKKNIAFLGKCLDMKQGIHERNIVGYNAIDLISEYEIGKQMLSEKEML